MTVELLVLALACFAASALLTQGMRKLALSQGLLDVPNERSSHARPTPRGGGAAIVATATVGFAVLALAHRLDAALLAALAGSVPVAAIGFMDDRRALPAAVRLAAQTAAAVWATAWLGGFPALRLGDHVISLGIPGFALAVLGIVWGMNLFNFMDGVDGIAASEATFVSWGGALLGSVSLVSSQVAWAAVLLGAACLGFLRLNWPPARIFMGDVGSGYLGYVIVVLAFGATRENPVALWVWLILGGVFFVDATVTLLRRLLRGERVHEAHRSHAYQWLARRWGSHRMVTLAVLAMNLAWLLPCAVAAARLPGYAALFVIVALAPLAVLTGAIGSGRADSSSM
jgi:Fuc2NAc and GlcNAc transferase